jgi:hypothetical protein
MTRWRSRPLVAICVLCLLALHVRPVAAHNEKVHRDMTDYAYEVMLAAAKYSNGEALPPDLQSLFKRLAEQVPGLNQFYADAAKAIPRLKGLPSGLPDDDKPCATPFLVDLFGGLFPDFGLPAGTALADAPLGQITLPLSPMYHNGNVVCGIDEQWTPSGALADSNPGAFTARDHTGVTLGYWAGQPDRELGDWRMRSTVLEELKSPANVAGAAAKTTVQIALACGLGCVFMPLVCLACPILAGGAAGFVTDELTSLNATEIESDDFTTLGHFMDMKPATPGTFDDRRGKLATASGPLVQPDGLEKVFIASFDVLGLHVNHEASSGPERYEIVLGTPGMPGDDLHQNSQTRTASDWETGLATTLEYTPGDNLGRYGLDVFRGNAGTPVGTQRLGWPLHAIGDATVPAMGYGASGWGKRPYEQSVENNWDVLVGSGNRGSSLATIAKVLLRAYFWRVIIQVWRTQNGKGTDIPLRDLVTGVSEITRVKAGGVPAVFKPIESLQWALGQQSQAEAAFETPDIQGLQHDLTVDGIGVSLAFLMSVSEVVQ